MPILAKKFYIIVPLFSFIITVLVIEVFLAIFYPILYTVPFCMYSEPDQFTGYKLKPNAVGYWQLGIVAKTNSHGHRNAEVKLQKDPGVFRIIVLGDSFTVGASVNQEEAYPQVLERLCTQNAKNKIEVINAGVEGWAPFQYAQYYEHYGKKFNADLVIVGFFVGNDTYSPISDVAHTPTAILGRQVTRDVASSWSIWIKIFLYDHFNIARIIINNNMKSARKVDYRRNNCNEFDERYLATQRQRITNHSIINQNRYILLKNNIEQIIKIKKNTDNDSAELIVAMLPDENQINVNLQNKLVSNDDIIKYDFDMPQEMISSILLENHINVIDMLKNFREYDGCLYLNDTHFTAKGHELAANLIYKYLIDHKIIETTQ